MGAVYPEAPGPELALLRRSCVTLGTGLSATALYCALLKATWKLKFVPRQMYMGTPDSGKTYPRSVLDGSPGHCSESSAAVPGSLLKHLLFTRLASGLG